MTHKTLLRQLNRLGLDEDSLPDAQTWKKLLSIVNASYKAHDEDRYLLERSLEVSSTEMQYMIDELKRSSESTMKTMLDSMQNGVMTISSKGMILSFNRSAQNMFGYTLGEVIDRNMEMLLPEKYRHDHDGLVNNNFSNMLSVPREVEARHKDGHVFPLLLMISEFYVGNERQFIVSCVDMTQQKQMDEQIRRSQRIDALGKLTGGIAHDYNNLLGVMIGYAELMEMLVGDNEKLLDYCQQIIKAGKRGSQLTQKLLSFSRPKLEESTRVDINHLLLDSREMLEKTLTVRVKISMQLQDELWPVWVDQGELENALLNLSINAMHAMPDGGSLHIATENVHLGIAQSVLVNLPEGDYVRLSLMDTGIGMDATTLQQVFDPFFTTKGEEGTGLGLSQVYTFVRHQGGGIYMDSQPGHGTTVSLYFPRYSGDVIEQENTLDNEALDDLPVTSARILVVDDEPALCLFVSEVLSDKGYEVLQAESAEEALECLAKESVDLVISDVLMPGMDGYRLAQKIKEQYPHIKIQLMSGYTDDKQETEEDKILSANLLRKPMGSKDILKKVADLLKSS